MRGRGGRVRRGVRRSPRGGRRLEVRFEGAVARCAARAWAADRRWRGFVVASAGWMRRNDFRAFSEDAGSWCSRVAARSRSPRARGSGAGGARGRGAACGMSNDTPTTAFLSPNAVVRNRPLCFAVLFGFVCGLIRLCDGYPGAKPENSQSYVE